MSSQGRDTADDNRIDFCTLGMFIIDEIHPPPNSPDQTVKEDIIGGAGTYAALGARLFSPPPHCRKISWVIDTGPDFPPSASQTISSWQTSAILRSREAPTTRGWNGYTNSHHREFKYLTPKLRVGFRDLPPYALRAKSFHLICNPSRLVEEIRILHQTPAPQPLIIWEPVPDLCVPEQLAATLAALHYIDVLSPNHEELTSLFNETHPPPASTEGETEGGVNKPHIQNLAQHLLSHVPSNPTLAILVRCGAEGVYIASNTAINTTTTNPAKTTTPRLSRWLPAYHSPTPQKVIDPTGGGNTFLGSFAVGLVRSGGDLVEAGKWGNVGAGVGIEQVGVPVLGAEVINGIGGAGDGEGDGEGEMWNGTSMWGRLREYKRREGVGED